MTNRSILIGPGVHLDLDRLISTRLLVQANSGGGKSWALRRLLEQTHGSVQQIVIDPEGEFASLRERFDYVLASRQGGYTAGAGAFNNPKGRLRSLGLIDYPRPGAVVAKSLLFLE